MTQVEFFRYTPRTMFLYVGAMLLVFYSYTRFIITASVREFNLLATIFLFQEHNDKKHQTGEFMWWDRQSGRHVYESGHGPGMRTPSLNA